MPESKKAVDRYLTEIMQDLVANLNSAMWRNRQSRLGLCVLSLNNGEGRGGGGYLWMTIIDS